MAPQRESAEIERIAAAAGVTPEQVRAVLAAAGPAAGPTAPVQVPVAAAWAGAGVALVAMFVFVATTNGFSVRPDGKVAALATGIVFSAAAMRAARLAARNRFALGEQLGLSIVALISPLIVWSLLWLLGLWPGHWAEVSPGGPAGERYWESGGGRPAATASLMVFLAPLLVGAWVLRRTGAGLSLGIAVAAAHGVIASLAAIAGIEVPGATAAALLAGAYTAGMLAGALRLEPGRRAWATWVHPFVIAGALAFVGFTAEAAGSATGLALGALLIAAGALLTVTLGRGLYLAAIVAAGAMWDFWLYDELSLGPVAGLALTLALGLGSLFLALRVWRQRNPGASSHQVA